MDMSTSTNGIRARFVIDDCYGFKKNRVYDAIFPKSKLCKAEVICVIDNFGEEYAYPAEWFEIIEQRQG